MTFGSYSFLLHGFLVPLTLISYLRLNFGVQTLERPSPIIMTDFFLHIGWFGRIDGRNEASDSPAGLKGNPGVEPGETPSEGYLNIQEYVRDSIQRGAYVDFRQLRRLVGPSLEPKGTSIEIENTP